MKVLQSVCSHGHKLQFGDVQQASNTRDPIKRKEPLFVRMPPGGVRGESRGVWVQLLKTVNGLADGTREWRNCFLAAARGLGFETSVLEPCVLVLRNTQQKYRGIVGVAVDDIAGGGDEVWKQAISKLKQRFTFGHWEVGKGKFCSREVVQAADGSMRVGQSAYIKNLDFVPLRKLRRALGYLARESRPDLSGFVSILQSRFNKAQVSDIQETNRVVRLAKAHKDLALTACKIPLDPSALCLMEMPVVETPVRKEHKLGM